jgi:mRNA-degrading endonuclease YafQ of YafQ-DinJ toxin-antitoxin module
MDRPIRKIFVSRLFEKNFKQLSKRIQNLAEKKEILFRENAFHPLLRTHQLGGDLKRMWAYSVNREYRVLFYFVDEYSVMYVKIGTHEIYK